MIELLSDKDKLVIINNLKNYTKEVFILSCHNLKPIPRAVSFAYGWLLIAYGSEYAVTAKKLANLEIREIQYIIDPLIKIAKILSADEKIFRNIGVSYKVENDLSVIQKFLFNVYTIFLTSVPRFKSQLDEILEYSEDTDILEPLLKFEFFDILYK